MNHIVRLLNNHLNDRDRFELNILIPSLFEKHQSSYRAFQERNSSAIFFLAYLRSGKFDKITTWKSRYFAFFDDEIEEFPFTLDHERYEFSIELFVNRFPEIRVSRTFRRI